jgi:nucleoside-diphosphate-sugar epimerase
LKNVLVTGATGAIGPVMVRQLLEHNCQVRALVRHPPAADTWPAAVQIHQGDITDSQALRAAVTGVDIVFHLAAKLHVSEPIPTLHAEYQRVNVEGTRRLAGVAQAAGVRRLVFFSTISVYGPSRPGDVLDESTPPQPQSPYAQSKLLAEEIVLGANQGKTNDPLAVVLRLAAVYGPRVRGNYARLVAALQRGWFVPLGHGRNRRTLVYDQDVATAALLAAERPQAAGQVYNVTDGQIYTFNEILAAICEALGRPPPRYHLPTPPVRFLAGVVESAFRLAGKRPLVDRATVDKMLEDVAVSGEKIQRELGFRPRFDLSSGWRETARQMAGWG